MSASTPAGSVTGNNNNNHSIGSASSSSSSSSATTSTSSAAGALRSPPFVQGGPGLGLKGGGKGGEPGVTLVVQNIVNCCNLQTDGWRKIFSAIALVVSIALVAFLICYTQGMFHFERFIGQIGPSVTLSAAGAMVFLSGTLLVLSLKK